MNNTTVTNLSVLTDDELHAEIMRTQQRVEETRHLPQGQINRILGSSPIQRYLDNLDRENLRRALAKMAGSKREVKA